ncbi:sulfotransferase [Candidatus Thioglobus sp.]|nr:sulfotransferase [Candidatus Thioglobus sp.]
MLKKPMNYAQLCFCIYEVYGKTKGHPFVVWGDKNNFYLNYIDKIHYLYSNARFLHIVRNGLDMAGSYRSVMNINSESPYAPKLPTEISDIASDWSNNLSKIHSSFALLPKEQHMTIRYEDLVNQPKSTLNEVCEWIKVEFEPLMLKFYLKNMIDKLEPKATMDWKKRTLEPISQSSIGAHSNFINNKEKAVFLRIAQNELNYYSYLKN